ncbi:MAG: methyltransferase domain-containing protein [Caldilinea sp. CFX5]|nr:methyltransferase domain-containing protein [Caldilinea sp. CFX5]
MEQTAFQTLIAPYKQQIVIDIGTGDGHFVYQNARQQAQKFFIGVDANASALAKVSEQIHRKAAKGGAPNALFLQAAVEDLPIELSGIASAVNVQFPWGSLLRGVINGEPAVLNNLRRICAPNAKLTIITALDPQRDQSEIERLGIQTPTLAYLQGELLPNYEAAGFAPVEFGPLAPAAWPQLTSSWAKRLRNNTERSLLALVLRAKG